MSPHGPPATVVDLVGSGTLRVCFDGRILEEYHAGLARARLGLESADVETVLARLTSNGIRFAPRPVSTVLPDPDDQPFLEVALAAEADYLITGNQRHFPADLCRGIAVVTPRDFVAVRRTAE